MSARPRRMLVGVAYLRLLRHYAAQVEAELARVDDLLRPASELGRRHDWLGAYLDLRLRTEMLVLVLSGLVSDPRLSTTEGPGASSPNSAEPSSCSPAD